LLISQEVDFAKMKLTDPLKTYWTDLPAAFDHITIQQAATHTAGLPFDAPPTLLSETDLLAFFNNKAPKQGKEWNYSNVGIGLLGYLLEKTSERPYDRIYRTHVSWPLGMLPVSTNVPDSLKPFYAQGYDLKGNPAPQVESGIFKGASALKMAASDMQNFLSAAIGLPGTPERIFYPMRMTQSVYVKLPERYQGLAWNIHPLTRRNMNKLVSDAFNFGTSPVTATFERPMFYGDALFDKTGTTKGFKAYIAVIPNKKSGVAILTNKNSQTNEIVTVGRQILFNLAKVDSSDYNKTPIVDEG
jgi:beta-lactamase class C